MVFIQFARELRAEPLVRELGHLQDQKTTWCVGPDFVANAHGAARARDSAIDFDHARFASVVGQGSRFENARRAEPAVDPRRVHSALGV